MQRWTWLSRCDSRFIGAPVSHHSVVFLPHDTEISRLSPYCRSDPVRFHTGGPHFVSVLSHNPPTRKCLAALLGDAESTEAAVFSAVIIP